MNVKISFGFGGQLLTEKEIQFKSDVPGFIISNILDGAWFEIHRKMLLNEIEYDPLIIGQAVPRDWLQSGKRIEVKNAPTYFGDVSFSIEGLSSTNEISAIVLLSERNPPKDLIVRFRHPEEKTILSVVVNGQVWKNYDVKK